MFLNASGYVNPANIAGALSYVTNHYKPLTLPICVDFDSVYDAECASRFVPRSNVDNSVENTFYVTKIQQAVANQQKLGFLPSKGSFYALLPCLSLILENRNNYSNNLVLELITIGEHNLHQMISELKVIYLKLGLDRKDIDFISVDETRVDVLINLIPVGSISTFQLPNGEIVTRATVVKEPIFSQSLTKTT